jgi:hypothetical protein
MKAACYSLLVFGVIFVSRAVAADPPDPNLSSLYPYGAYPVLLKSPRVKSELKITSNQEVDIAQCMKKYRAGFVDLFKTKLKPLEIDRKNFDSMWELLSKSLNPDQMKRLRQIIIQMSGIEMFDYKEVRTAINLPYSDVAKLKAVHLKMCNELTAKAGKKIITPQESGRLFGVYSKGVQDRVRAALNDEQRAKLQDLIGNNFDFEGVILPSGPGAAQK